MYIELKRNKDDEYTLIKANEDFILETMAEAYRLAVLNPGVYFSVLVSPIGKPVIVRHLNMRTTYFDLRFKEYLFIKKYDKISALKNFLSDEVIVEDCEMYIMNEGEKITYNIIMEGIKRKRKPSPSEKVDIIIEYFPKVYRNYMETIIPYMIDFYKAQQARTDFEKVLEDYSTKRLYENQKNSLLSI